MENNNQKQPVDILMVIGVDQTTEGVMLKYERDRLNAIIQKMDAYGGVFFDETTIEELWRYQDFNTIEIVGAYTETDILSAALRLAAVAPEWGRIVVDQHYCIGLTPETEREAFHIMAMNGIETYEIENDEEEIWHV